MESFYRRKLQRDDPFGKARRGADFRLEQLKEKILGRFKGKEERDIMRRTLDQLLGKEETFQGRIDRLIAIAGGIELASFQDDFLDTQDSFVGEDSVVGCRRAHTFASEQFEQAKHPLSTLYSTFGDKNRKYPLESSRKSYDNLQNGSVLVPGRLINCKDRYISPNHMKSNNTLLSNNSFEEQIDQKDLFSFRTQKGGSPSQPNKHHLSDHDLSGSVQRDVDYSRVIQYSSRSKSGKKSQVRQKSSGSKQKNNGNKLTSPKKISYDGKGLIYLENPSSYSRVKQLAKSKSKKSMNPEALKKIMKRISTRLQLSDSVVDTINHSTPIQSDNYILNRLKHQKEARCSLASQISAVVAKRHRWM